MPSSPSGDMSAFREGLKSSKRIICVAGAGLSAASGIPTFRGAGGWWRRYEATSLATPEAFRENPSRVWQFYHFRREAALKAKPNAAHYAIAMLSIPSYRSTVASQDAKFTLITQNVDELTSPQNPYSLEDPDPDILQMHGSVFDVKCTRCRHIENNRDSPICPALAGTETNFAPNHEGPEPEIPVEQLPHCKKCGGLARPGVVWFGESIPGINRIFDLAGKADSCLVVGTSSVVQPAASLADEVQNNGGKVAVFNIEESQGSNYADFLLLGPCEETLPKALGLTSADIQKVENSS
ncbi:DHS-like NAD/FAD-binding domain-containing protein [Panus rudis PR-1116 ss-1]|nr:DHS-like NAD/FAD-binding domain-containing protein [Panus rudis PR-1116 ss-1]